MSEQAKSNLERVISSGEFGVTAEIGPPRGPDPEDILKKARLVRGVADANLLLKHGVECSLSSNNILNPATPYGDCSLIRMANLYANVLQLDRPAELCECFGMLTDRSARLLNLKDYGFAVGNLADVVVIGAQAPEQAIAEISQPLAVFKRGRRTVVWHPPELLRPN